MTCIVGLTHPGGVVIGGDSAGVAGLDLTVRADRKVFRNGDFLMGFTSSFRMGQLLAYKLVPPTPREGHDTMRYLVTDYIDAVRDCLKAGGFARSDNSVESGGVFLVGYAGRLFQVASDYQVGESAHGYDACGCGESFALGALHANRNNPDPVARVMEALEAAEAFSAGVRRPFVIEQLGAA